MNNEPRHYLDYLEFSLRNSWDAPAVSDYDGQISFSYKQVAEQIAKLHILYKNAGIKQGDKIAICGRNSSMWAINFLAATSYGCIAVSILADFNAEGIHALVNHSDAILFMAGPVVWNKVAASEMPNVRAIMSTETLELFECRDERFAQAHANIDKLFAEEYPDGFLRSHVRFERFSLDDTMIINYTSGTTSDPKGVMLSWRSISSNVQYGQDNIPSQVGWSMVSMLPLAHMFGMAFEFLYQLAGGCHVYFLNKTPSPAVLMKAFADVHPYMILTVPLVIEKIFKSKIFPVIHKPLMRILWYIPGINNIIYKKIHQQLMNAFGGNLRYLIIGGAALNHEVEHCLKKIKFPFTIGYGMTECGPLLGYAHWKNFKERSCGRIVDRMQVRIDSENPLKTVGEIQVRGSNIMQGYYKNEEATRATFTEDGWMRTGDLGVIDKAGNISIRGRAKCMILGPSGQNIYPEEIEDKVNNMPYVVESLVVDRGGKLTALVFADKAAIAKEQATRKIEEVMEDIRQRVNKLLPLFCRLSNIEVVEKEFEKTPKKSIKRFLYK